MFTPFFYKTTMAIGNSKLHKLLNKGILLDDAIAWFDFFTTQNRTMILDMIRIKQLKEQGINKDGDVIGVYSEATEWITNGEKQAGDPYTLEDTGAFYRSMFMTVYKDLFEVNANAQKEDTNLFDAYGTGIVGLTEQNKSILIDKLRQHYINYARKILLGT
jgi:hypothetical protein